MYSMYCRQRGAIELDAESKGETNRNAELMPRTILSTMIGL
jgi:hypothetical protein